MEERVSEGGVGGLSVKGECEGVMVMGGGGVVGDGRM